MKFVSLTIICEIGNVIQINERFFLTQLDPERHSLLFGEFNQSPKNKIVCKNTVDNFFSVSNFIEALLGDAIADHYLQVKRFVTMPIEDILCYILSFLYHLSNNYHEWFRDNSGFIKHKIFSKGFYFYRLRDNDTES